MAGTTLLAASNALEKTREQLVNECFQQALTLWRSLTPADWWNDLVTYGIAARMAMLESSLIAQARRLGVSYADATLRMIGVSPQGTVEEGVYPRVNTDPWLVNARPADTYREKAIQAPTIRPESWPDEGSELYEEVEAWRQSAYERLQNIIETNVERAVTSATIDRYRRSKVLQYRRVPHPELSRTGTCGLCLVAADRWYSTNMLLPIHNNCRCGVAPAGESYDPGFQLTRDDLQRLYDEAGGNTADRLSNVRVKTITHGELGPILAAYDAKTSSKDWSGSGKEWEAPDRKNTLAAYKRMRERAVEFSKRYKQVLDTNENVRFTWDGRSYTFKPGKHAKQAWSYQKALLSQLEALLK